MTIISDIDGTIANVEHRLSWVRQQPKDWKSFQAACMDDTPYLHVVRLLQLAKVHGVHIALITGRPCEMMAQTQAWLRRWVVPYDELHMRQTGDHRSDVAVKQQLYLRYVLGREIWFVLEDRERVVDMWRELGLVCFQVKRGDY